MFARVENLSALCVCVLVQLVLALYLCVTAVGAAVARVVHARACSWRRARVVHARLRAAGAALYLHAHAVRYWCRGLQFSSDLHSFSCAKNYCRRTYVELTSNLRRTYVELTSNLRRTYVELTSNLWPLLSSM